MDTAEFITSIDDAALIHAIKQAEVRTSGEVRVFISSQPVEDAVLAAWKAFSSLKMQHTAQRNGALIFVAPQARKFAIVGDEGIHRHCETGYWDKLAARMAAGFRAGEYTRVLVETILELGLTLAHHFPGTHEDVNELPDDIARD